jgi:hypothetical protein
MTYRWKSEQVALSGRRVHEQSVHSRAEGEPGPAHLSHPWVTTGAVVGQQGKARPRGAGHRRSPMQHVSCVEEDRASWTDHGDFIVVQFAGLEAVRYDRKGVANLTRDHLRRSVEFRDIGQQNERGELWPPQVGTWNNQAVVAEVSVMSLLVIDGAAVLPPELHLVEIELLCSAESLGSIDKVRVKRDSGERPGIERPQAKPGELMLHEVLELRGIGEVGLGLWELLKHSLLRRSQLIAGKKPFENGETVRPDFVEYVIVNAHVSLRHEGYLPATVHRMHAPRLTRLGRAGTVWLIGVACLLLGCGASRPVGPEEVFRRWNQLAVRGSSEAPSLLCANPPTTPEFDDPIAKDAPGFRTMLGRPLIGGPIDLKVFVDPNGTQAFLDFTDPGTAEVGDEEDVYVLLVRESEQWKVCTSRVVAAGGIG